MIRINNTLQACESGHILLKSRKTCAHCDGYTEAEFLAAAKGQPIREFVAKRGDSSRIAVQYLGKLYPMDKADFVNGLHPSIPLPDGWYIYYTKFRADGQEVYKIGISQKPWYRAGTFGGSLVWCEYIGRYEDAYAQEQRIIRNHAAYRVNIKGLRHNGGTECFSKDVLGKG